MSRDRNTTNVRALRLCRASTTSTSRSRPEYHQPGGAQRFRQDHVDEPDASGLLRLLGRSASSAFSFRPERLPHGGLLRPVRRLSCKGTFRPPVRLPLPRLYGYLDADRRARTSRLSVSMTAALRSVAAYSKAPRGSESTGFRKIAHEPQVIILDEPSMGSTDGSARNLSRALSGLGARRAATHQRARFSRSGRFRSG